MRQKKAAFLPGITTLLFVTFMCLFLFQVVVVVEIRRKIFPRGNRRIFSYGLNKVCITVMLLFTLIFAAVFASMGIIALPTTNTKSEPDYYPVTIEQISPLQQIVEGSTLQLQCFVTFHDENELRIVEWQFVSDQTEDERPKVLTSNGSVVNSDEGRIKAAVKRRWDAVVDVDVEEHYLTVSELGKSDEGIYICKAKSVRNGTTLAEKHSVVAIQPPNSHPTASLIELDVEEVGKMQSGDRSSGLETGEFPPPTLGPVRERYVVATRGANVVLECRDADDKWDVYWKKQGDPSFTGEGKELRLFRVDRWDSGLYYCTTNRSTFEARHNVSLDVALSPTVERTNPTSLIVKRPLNREATLTCKVEAIPVPRISWFKITNDSTSSSGIYKRHLKTGDEFSISVGAYKDGLIECSLRIANVTEAHFGRYRCEARNGQGEDGVDFVLEEGLLSSTSSSSSSTRISTNLLPMSCLCLSLLSVLTTALSAFHRRISFTML